MDSRQIKKVLVLLLMASATAAWMSSCAGKADVVRPGTVQAGASLGEKLECTDKLLKDPNGTERFVVEWNDGDRATLESEMARGIALVKFTCDGIKVLRNCAIPGEYAYQGISKKTKSLQVSDAASASANFSSPTLTGSVKTALEQGRALNLGYVMVGVQSTTVADVTREQIKRDACKQEATHFVFQTKVGAFAMASGEKGQAMAAGDLLGYGSANGEVSSSKSVAATDGDAKACKDASSSDDSPTENCQAVMRVSILPLADGKIQAVSVAKGDGDGGAAKAPAAKRVDPRTCPEGFVYQDEECVKKAEAEAFLCEEGNESQCKEQCNKGSASSCGRFADIVFSELSWPSAYLTKDLNEDGMTLINTKAGPMQAKLEAACRDEWEASACLVAGMLIGTKEGDNSSPDNQEQANAMVELMTTGCEWGNDTACGFIVDAFGEDFYKFITPNGAKMEEVVAEGCDYGSVAACHSLGTFFVSGTMLDLNGNGVKADKKKAVKYLSKACYGGVGEACFWTSVMLGANNVDSCMKLVKDNVSAEDVELYISLTFPTPTDEKQVRAFCEDTKDLYDKEKAYGLADKACYLSGGDLTDAACGVSVDLGE